jgi:hypothetical protein
MNYKVLITALLSLSFHSTSFAECNLKVAKAAGQYLAVLEKEKLRRYQNNSVCEVLSYEFWNCTEKQKSKLNVAFNAKEVLGNYCHPHLPPPKNYISKEQYMKGADLYSWQDYSGYVWMAILPGTNRTRSTKELIESKVSPGYIKLEIKNIPSKSKITWNNLVSIEDKSNLEFSLPNDKTIKEIMKSGEQADIDITVIR